MPIHEVSPISSAIPPPVPQGRERTAIPSVPGNVVPHDPRKETTAPGLTLTQQAAQLLHDLLQHLPFGQPSAQPEQTVTTTAVTPIPAQQSVAPPSPADVLVAPPERPSLPATAAAPFRDPTPFAIPVYEVRKQTPTPGNPAPIKKKLPPPLPLGQIKPVDRAIPGQEQEKRRLAQHGGLAENTQEKPSSTERALHQVVEQANNDLQQRGIPLRLVLARSGVGYVLDIYNCASQDVCRLEQEVPLDLNELATLLDSIQHESGIIVNVKM